MARTETLSLRIIVQTKDYMTNTTFHYLKNRVYLVHHWLIQAAQSVSDAQFSHVFSKDAPPIGWHLWHMARFSDRLQSKLTAATGKKPGTEIWYRGEGVASNWQLVADRLGVYETGMGQAPEDAQATMVQVGQATIIDYASAVFDACNSAVDQLSDSDMQKTYFGILDYAYDGNTGQVWAGEPKASVIGEDLIFHLTHGSRHVGMMEALRGLLGSAGTLSV